jgi:hypothetical protein
VKRGPLKMPLWCLQGVGNEPCHRAVLLADELDLGGLFSRVQVRQLCHPLGGFSKS